MTKVGYHGEMLLTDRPQAVAERGMLLSRTTPQLHADEVVSSHGATDLCRPVVSLVVLPLGRHIEKGSPQQHRNGSPHRALNHKRP